MKSRLTVKPSSRSTRPQRPNKHTCECCGQPSKYELLVSVETRHQVLLYEHGNENPLGIYRFPEPYIPFGGWDITNVCEKCKPEQTKGGKFATWKELEDKGLVT